MDISVPYKQVENKEAAYQEALKQITPEYIAKWNIKAEVNCDEARHCMSAKGKGFDLKLEFKESECEVSLDLSFLLKPFRKNVLETIERKLIKHL
jgi:hypothetical protein